jgi:hypothetical protein
VAVFQDAVGIIRLGITGIVSTTWVDSAPSVSLAFFCIIDPESSSEARLYL